MNDLTTVEGRIAEIARIAAALGTNSERRILSALGHPGYEASFAANVLGQWVMRPGVTLHQIVYGE